jgi:hypothetical protein
MAGRSPGHPFRAYVWVASFAPGEATQGVATRNRVAARRRGTGEGAQWVTGTYAR